MKIDLTGLSRSGGAGGGGGADPYGPLAPWMAEAEGLGTERGAEGLPLRDVVDRASAQVLVLRKAVEEAAIADRVVRQHNGELEKRLAQGERFAAELDQRLMRAGKAAEVVEKAASALSAMETVVSQVRASQEALARGFESKLQQQKQAMEAELARQQQAMEAELTRQQQGMEARMASRAEAMEAEMSRQQQGYEERMAAQRELFEKRIADLAGAFERGIAAAGKDAAALREEFERTMGAQRKSIMQQTEQLCAGADRYVAQAQARASMIVDAVADRVDVLTQQCNRIGSEAEKRMERAGKR